jgi:hypothetical protein
MRAPITVSLIALLSGCAVQHETLRQYGDYELEGQLLKGFKVSAAGAAPMSALPGCVASTISNDPVTLSDSAGSFVGAYTGTYYQVGSRREVGGGNIIQYISPGGEDIVAKGATMYSSGLIQRSVRFTLRIRDLGPGRLYQFSGIEQAQTSTGYMPNSGYNRVHAAPGGGAGHVLGSLKSITADLESCIGSTPAGSPAATTNQSPAPAGASSAYKDQQLRELSQQNLPYEEYQKRYRQIMGE